MGNRKYGLFGAVFALSLLADQLTKVWARASLAPLHRPIVIIDGYFDLRYSENPGSAFGLFRDFEYARYLLFVVGIVALVVIGLILWRMRPDKLRIAAELGLLAGGAVGNIIDRVRFGRVTDFILWKIHEHEWPVFNIADAALVVGVLALLVEPRGDDAARPGEAEASPDVKSRRKR